jgi:hypothetical protein
VTSSRLGSRDKVDAIPGKVPVAHYWPNIVISNNVGGVKHFLSTLLHALEEERHFALVGGLRFPTWARF